MLEGKERIEKNPTMSSFASFDLRLLEDNKKHAYFHSQFRNIKHFINGMDSCYNKFMIYQLNNRRK